MSKHDLTVQGAWEVDHLRQAWPAGHDLRFVIGNIGPMVVARTAAEGAEGRLLEVAAAEAVHACKLALAGFDTYVLEPSPAMLEKARESMTRLGTRVTLVRGICESLPFADGSFARVLCDSAIDHFASPDLGIREMARVLEPGGTLIVSFVNYGGLAVRASRALYHVDRALRPRARAEKRFWDSPVPSEHVFECTVPILQGMCAQYLEHDETFGISLGAGLPGWGTILERLPARRRDRVLRRLDRVARTRPTHADFVVSIWRRGGPDRRFVTPAPAHPSVHRSDAERSPIPIDTLHVTPADPVYRHKVALEQRYPHDWVLATDPSLVASWERFENRLVTGDPSRSWLDVVAERGPFGEAAFLGVDGSRQAAAWLAARASRRLDVFDVTQSQLDAVAAAVPANGAAPAPLRLVRTDLNFVRLPTAAYDVIVSSGTLHHLHNLEHLLDEVRRGLRPGGLFVLHDFVGEQRHRYSERRLALVNRLLAEIPDAYHLDPSSRLVPGEPYLMSPFCGLRSEETVGLVHERFEVEEETLYGHISPLPIMLDLRVVEREAPELLARLHALEAESASDRGPAPFGAFIIARR